MAGKNVVVGLSGGIDSAVSAVILKEQSYEVTGLLLNMWSEISNPFLKTRFEQERREVEKLAQYLGIRVFVEDVGMNFRQKIFEPYLNARSCGISPFPCIPCNPLIKFTSLIDFANDLGIDRVATGHYARIGQYKGKYFLKQAADIVKDQSFMLYALGQLQLDRCIFPLGNMMKSDVRKLAGQKLPSGLSKKRESFDLCFAAGFQHDDFMAQMEQQSLMKPKEFNLVFSEDDQTGQKMKASDYTCGMMINRNSIDYFASFADYSGMQIRAGSFSAALSCQFYLQDIRLQKQAQFEFVPEMTVKIRGKDEHHEVKNIEMMGSCFKISTKEKLFAPASGQSAVFYKGKDVLAGGIIVSESEIV